MPAVLTPPATAPVPLSPAEYVQSLSPADREVALAMLVLLAPKVGGELVPVKVGGRVIGHFVPVPKGDPEQLKRILASRTPEEEEASRRALATPGNSISFEEMMELLRPQASEYR